MVAQLVALYLPALLVKTFSMAMLLAGLLGFGRLSSDSEIVAMKAGGASVPRIIRPVVLASLGVSVVMFWFNDAVVPRAARTAVTLGDDGSPARARSAARRVRQGNHREGQDRRLHQRQERRPRDPDAPGRRDHVYDENEEPDRGDARPQRQLQRAADDWRIDGGARIVPLDADINPRAVIDLRAASGPSTSPKPKATLEDLLAQEGRLRRLHHQGDSREDRPDAARPATRRSATSSITSTVITTSTPSPSPPWSSAPSAPSSASATPAPAPPRASPSPSASSSATSFSRTS